LAEHPESPGSPGSDDAGTAGAAPRLSRRRLLAGSAAAAGALAGTGLVGGGALADLLGLGSPVRVAVPWSATELHAFRAVLDGLNLPYAVELLPLGDDISTALGPATPRRPDVVMMPQPGTVRHNAADLESLPGDVDRPGTWPPSMVVRNSSGALLGMPFKMAHESVVWYRPSVYRACGVRPPQTWSQWTQVNRTLVEHDVTPLALPAGDGWMLAQTFDNVLLRCAPGEHVRLVRGQPDWTRDNVVKAFRMLARMWAPRHTLAEGFENSLVQQFPDAVVEVFGHGRAASVVAPDFAESVIRQFADDPGDVDVFPFPVVDGDGADTVADPLRIPPIVVGGDIAVLPNGATHHAEDLIRRLSQPGAAEPWISGTGGFLAANRLARPVYSPVLGRLAGELADARRILVFNLPDALGRLGGRDGLWQVLQHMLAEVGQGGPDAVHDAAERAAQRMADLAACEGSRLCR
jgi:alpha-glucoside transport system substrate-binding protein